MTQSTPTTPDLTTTTIGIVGLGRMSVPIARQLRDHGSSLRLWNRTREKAEHLARTDTDIEVCACPRDVAAGSDITIVMVTDANAVETVVFDLYEDAYGVIHGLDADDLLIDMGTTAALRTREFADRLRKIGAEWMDAPVLGGTLAAEAGELAIMAGGSDNAFDRAYPLFSAIGNHITHVGAIGAGQIAKSTNQMIVGLTIGAVAEAFALARHAGVEPGKIREALLGDPAHSRILDMQGERMIGGDYQPRTKCSIQHKDVAEAMQLATSVGISLPGLKTNMKLWDHMLENGMADLDHSALLLAIDPGSGNA